MSDRFGALQKAHLVSLTVFSALLAALFWPAAASARPTIELACEVGDTRSGSTCFAAEPKATCPNGYDPFPSSGSVDKCYAPAINNYTSCPPGGNPDTSTMHSDGTFKGCLADVIYQTTYPAKRTKFCAGERVTVDLTKGQSPTQGNDVIWGTSRGDTIQALGGNDIVCGRGGSDRIYGGSGRDRIYGNAGNDVIYGNAQRDRISGGTGDDWIHGGSGSDLLNGNAGNDAIYGKRGNDRINGGSGINTCSGGSGADRITPGTCQ